MILAMYILSKLILERDQMNDKKATDLIIAASILFATLFLILAAMFIIDYTDANEKRALYIQITIQRD